MNVMIVELILVRSTSFAALSLSIKSRFQLKMLLAARTPIVPSVVMLPLTVSDWSGFPVGSALVMVVSIA